MGQHQRIAAVAHRGASGHAPENTLAAFKTAVEMGALLIELDVHLSRDGEIIVIHDPTVDRTTNGTGAVRNLTLAELKELDAGSWFNRRHPGKARSAFRGERIPTLRETIDLLDGFGTGIFIEIKDPHLYPEDFEERILSLLGQRDFLGRAELLSFSAGSVARVKRLDSTARTALLVSDAGTDPVALTVAAGADELALRHSIITPKIAQDALDKGLGLVAWTANSVRSIRRLIGLGVNRIISNYPDRVLRLLAE